MTQRGKRGTTDGLPFCGACDAWHLPDFEGCRAKVQRRLDIVWRGTVALSDRPADLMSISVDREKRTITIGDVNGAPMAMVYCPALWAGADPKDLQ